jgi:hypothetical protein
MTEFLALLGRQQLHSVRRDIAIGRTGANDHSRRLTRCKVEFSERNEALR